VSDRPLLLSVPNVSEGSDAGTIDAIGRAFAPARLLDLHTDPDHGRSVYSLAAPQGELAEALLNGARTAIARIDVRRHRGLHPHVGAIDVAPVVYVDESDRGAACAEALTAAALIGDELELPVFLYGDLATTEHNRERANIRRGGPAGLAERMATGELTPDYGPPRPHETAGALLVTARPPLIAFNVDLTTDDVELAKRIAARLRESGGGPLGVRAIGLYLPARGRAQVSFNVHDHAQAPLKEIVEEVAKEAPIAEAELVGLAPAAAFADFPPDIPIRDFDPEQKLIENALRSSD
jgi:glutamate formiminotransferase/glutamate formiminotransferase/formiminotetrahydrofolate cyclodeaminase